MFAVSARGPLRLALETRLTGGRRLLSKRQNPSVVMSDLYTSEPHGSVDCIDVVALPLCTEGRWPCELFPLRSGLHG